ncbi:pyruvate dehydrogenase (acetyl-transferring) E1 component, alpha subunit [Caldalkalibacillus thermarum TA2.A1]|uniref:Pyruvate dehydrogenase E1 component subunit alpha n=2 Tax=Caldalkalibacillus thermarum (strain TA2.A1) TaxID=986075 RepID=F5L5S5_CALTT|nr:pyruvate dehydrogenase (acetyl-transferring) E1 component, alpha subunit [Caldalkalibacillus thermarum TA2.A1]
MGILVYKGMLILYEGVERMGICEAGLVQVLNEDGRVVGEQPQNLSDAQLKDLYRRMQWARLFDQRAMRLQRQGRIGTYAPLEGQEAAQVGSSYVLEKGDWLFPTYRDLAACFNFGLSYTSALLYTMGHWQGGRPEEGYNLFPISIMIATQLPQAVGAAWASKLKQDGRVALVYFGDGATSKGDFHEALNLASVLKAPVVFFCQNNQWAISVPLHKQTGHPVIADKAQGYGLPGVRVDGNDVLAVWKVTKEAVERARRGEGPTLIEALTYRLGPHTTADDPTRYRPAEELERWKEQRDPLRRFRLYLEREGLWSVQEEEQSAAEFKAVMDEALKKAEQTPKSQLQQAFDYVYANPPQDLLRQQEEVLSWRQRKGRVSWHN